MRFFADQNVDADVVSALTKAGHQAWTADQAGLTLDADDELTAYAHDRNAVLLTHDREFSQRRRENVIGRHVWLDCDELDAPDLLMRYLEDLLPVFEHHEHVMVRVAPSQYVVCHGWL